MTSTPPGWYDDGHGAQRWWDGAQWTEHAVPVDAAGPTPAASAPAEAAPAYPTAPEAAPAYPTAPEAAPAYPSTPAYAAAPAAPPLPPELAGEGSTTPIPPYAGGNAAYPGVYPGTTTSGAFVAATEPKRSKTWIIWLVVGVVLLGIVIAAAVLIPIFFLGLASQSAQPSGDNEEQAVAAVQLYDEAWRDVDCDKYFDSTTEDFREALGMTDCETFESSAQDVSDSTEDYTVRVTSVEQDGSTIIVSTSETYDSYYDENGDPADPPVPLEDIYAYEVILQGDSWVIDDAS